MIENFGDAPFHGSEVAPITIAVMSRIVSKIVDEVARIESIPVGVNVLRNDAAAALSIASASGANFIRVNIHVGGMMTDQGLIEGKAAETLRLREQLGHGPDSSSPIAIFADVGVKHATPLDSDWMLEREAQDCWNRGLADALIVSGSGTGQATSPEDLARVRLATPHATLLVGSGATSGNLPEYLQHADGAIVGTCLKQGGDLSKNVDLSIVSEVIKSAKGTKI
jgi:membrane complex biogenesis BtpA family protein